MIAKALRKARRMSWQEWRLLLEAARLALFVEIALRVWPFDTLLARLEAASARPVPFSALGRSDASHPSRTVCAHAVDLTYRLLPLPRTCLKESLVLFGLLRRRGIDARFCLGVRKEGERLVAHAWIHWNTPPEIDPRVRLKPDTTERATRRKPDTTEPATTERTDKSYLLLPIPDP